jgi:hypothetical protein
MPYEETTDEPIDGPKIVAEYAHLKERIMDDSLHTAQDGGVTIVTDSLYIPEEGDVLDKVRGGRMEWEETYLGQPLTRVDDDPGTYDRISVERTVRLNGEVHGTSSLIYGETTETLRNGTDALVISKLERYTQYTPAGAVTGERFVKVKSPSGEVLEHRHLRVAPD